MPASFLCDREKTIVCKEQPGFCNFIVLPIWKLTATFLPAMEGSYCRAQDNVVNWEEYGETEEDKLVYKTKISKKMSVNLLDDTIT